MKDTKPSAPQHEEKLDDLGKAIEAALIRSGQLMLEKKKLLDQDLVIWEDGDVKIVRARDL